MPETTDRLGPVDVLIIEFPDGAIRAEGFARLVDLTERQVIRVLDLEFVRRPHEGAMELLDIADAVAGAPEPLDHLIGASTALLDLDDLDVVGEVIEPGSTAAVLLYEQVWVLPLADAFGADGARIASAAHVDPLEVIEALAHF
ncbi:MAG: DUF6325 family protein [Micrococcales bacterium]|nr:DUF6325 family protein [Micrococcales bacterium]